MISKLQIGLKSLLHRELSEPEFYGDLMCKLKKIVGSHNFSAQFIKIISHYKKIGYNINVLQQTACLEVNPITVGNFAFLFNCTPVGQTSDSITVPTERLIYRWDGRGLMLWLLSGPLGLTLILCLYNSRIYGKDLAIKLILTYWWLLLLSIRCCGIAIVATIVCVVFV